MAKDVGDAIGAVIGHAAREVADTVSANARKGSKKTQLPSLSGGKGVAAGAGLVALVPLAAKGAGMVVNGLRNGARPLQAAGDKVSDTVEGAVGKKVDEAGGAAGLAKEAGKGMLPFGGGGKKSNGGGVGHGRRMPIQQAVDVAAPIDEVYEKWTQYEEWPKFMHRLDRVSQEDEDDEDGTTISFKAKIWGISREFKAEIIDERPQERIKWRVTEGVSHTGVVTFHELGPRLTRVDVDIDVHPGSMIEKLGRGLRHVKRAVRADLHRFKAHVEIEDENGEDEPEAAEDQQPTQEMEQEQEEQEEPDEQEQEDTDEQEEQEQVSRPSAGPKGRRAASSSPRQSSGRSSRSGSGGRSSRSGGANGAAASGGSRARARSSSANGSGSSRSGSSRSSGSSRRRSTSRSS